MTKGLYANAAETLALLREGQKYRHDRARAADMITVDEAASLMKVDASTIANWISGGRCIGVVGPDREMRVPRWQLEPSAWASIQPIAECLGSKDAWQVLDFLETPAPALDGLTPRVALEQGAPLARVLAAAMAE
ncbi:helix-turn-helix domain-containing protein [Variovorax sp. LjRoot84]|uniref:helix-turn-helix domain-containing protein n=1 Tax=Variovorax sp. LjRoot84 TaxID=3342340 RepID=UPI003ECD58AE